jgi:lysophospholipase L1-like esterase
VRITSQNNQTTPEEKGRAPVLYEDRSRAPKRLRYLLALVVAVGLAGWSLRPPPDFASDIPKKPTLRKALPMGPASPKIEKPSAAVKLTSCQKVVHIGDSTSLGLISKGLLPDANDRLKAQYEAVGVEHFYSEISGARSMVETYQDKPNATQVAKSRREKGYSGCWVLALGTNDPANTKGDAEMLSKRIDAMMKVIGDDPVLWTTTKSLREKGAYQNSRMESWNKTLTEACARYKNMRVYDWANEVEDEWFKPDGLHPNSVGSKERAARIAQALARAFPKDGSSPSGCLVLSSD